MRLFRRHVAWSAKQGSELGQAVLARQAGGIGRQARIRRMRDTKIHYGDTAVRCHHDVLGFQVAVDYALGVRRFKPSARLQHNLRRLFRIQLAAFAEEIGNLVAVDVLHADEAQATDSH